MESVLQYILWSLIGISLVLLALALKVRVRIKFSSPRITKKLWWIYAEAGIILTFAIIFCLEAIFVAKFTNEKPELFVAAAILTAMALFLLMCAKNKRAEQKGSH